jgi:histidinol-phosphate aminotransferase
MSISRRTILRQVGLSAVASTVSRTVARGSVDAPLPTGEICLDKNENPYGPSEKALSAMQSAMNLSNRFPSSEIADLVNQIAELHRVKPEQVAPGAGSTEILRMAAAAYLPSGKRLVLASPTFNAIAQFASSFGSEVVAVPLTKTYAHDFDAMLARINSTTGLIYICNPNNPTGTLSHRSDIEEFLRKIPGKLPILIDEAYHQYVNAPSTYASFIERPVDDDRVIVTRTFSAIYGLAGVRVGYAVSSRQVARDLSQNRLPFSISVLGSRAAAAALGDTDYVSLSARRNTDDRQEFFNQANGRMNRWIDSHTNFVMMKGGLPAQQIIEHFRQHNIFLGPLINEMPKYVHISIGRREEMREFWRVWDMLPPHPMPM